MKTIVSPISTKSLDENGILHIRVTEGAHVDLDSIRADHQLCLQLTGGRKVPALFDASVFFTITAEARDYAKEHISDRYRVATAVLTNKVGVKILAQGYININQPVTPVKIFCKQEEALEWLLGFAKADRSA